MNCNTLQLYWFRFRYCQFQVHAYVGSVDCGLFAIAFASIIAHGDDPGCYTFDQNLMRDHLHQCFIKGAFSSFPVRRKNRRNARISHMACVPIYCLCRMPEMCGIQMVNCNNCVKITPDQLKTKSIPWYCNKCIH